MAIIWSVHGVLLANSSNKKGQQLKVVSNHGKNHLPLKYTANLSKMSRTIVVRTSLCSLACFAKPLLALVTSNHGLCSGSLQWQNTLNVVCNIVFFKYLLGLDGKGSIF